MPKALDEKEYVPRSRAEGGVGMKGEETMADYGIGCEDPRRGSGMVNKRSWCISPGRAKMIPSRCPSTPVGDFMANICSVLAQPCPNVAARCYFRHCALEV